MGKPCAHLLFVLLLFTSCICLVPAQSRRAPREKTTTPGAPGTGPSSAKDAEATPNASAIKNASQPKIPLLVMLSRPRRLVMLPSSNEAHAERIAKSLGRELRLSVRFDPQRMKLEDAQTRLRAGTKTYMLLLRFEELDDRDDSKSCPPGAGRGVTSYKMDYTLLAPETGEVVKPKSIQTFFSCARDVKPLFALFVKNCVNRSRNSLDDDAVQCMTQHVLIDLFNFARPREAKKD